jgi:hypothetical protein
MKIIQIGDDKAHWITPYKTLEEAPPYSPVYPLVEALDEVEEGWDYKDGVFAPPEEPERGAEPYQPTNAEVIQAIEDVRADLIIAGVI